jgi:hypothetical protein
MGVWLPAGMAGLVVSGFPKTKSEAAGTNRRPFRPPSKGRAGRHKDCIGPDATDSSSRPRPTLNTVISAATRSEPPLSTIPYIEVERYSVSTRDVGQTEYIPLPEHNQPLADDRSSITRRLIGGQTWDRSLFRQRFGSRERQRSGVLFPARR